MSIASTIAPAKAMDSALITVRDVMIGRELKVRSDNDILKSFFT